MQDVWLKKVFTLTRKFKRKFLSNISIFGKFFENSEVQGWKPSQLVQVKIHPGYWRLNMWPYKLLLFMQSSRVRWKLSWVDTLGKVSVTEAGHLQKCKNTEFLWELRKMGICDGGHMYHCLLAKVPVRRVSTVFYSKQNQIAEEICNRLYD